MSRHSLQSIRSSSGFTLVEVAIVLLISGALMQMVIKGQDLILNARVRDLMAQQGQVETAILAFQDRYRALPGDYAQADTTLHCGASACLNGNGNGRIEAGTGGATHEEILAWNHLYAADFLQSSYVMATSATAAPDVSNTPQNAFGGFLEIAFDNQWGIGSNAPQHNLKTGNLIPATVLAEVDNKIDDGLPGTGRLRFSSYAGNGPAPQPGTAGSGSCTEILVTVTRWRVIDGSDNCGATTLLR